MLKKYLFILVALMFFFLESTEATQKIDASKNKKSSKPKK